MARAVSTQRKAAMTAVAWLVGGLIFFPILWTVLRRFKTEIEAISTPPALFDFAWTTENYRVVNTRSNYPLHAMNSVVIAVGSTLLGLLIAIPAAWAFAFSPGRGPRTCCSGCCRPRCCRRWACWCRST
jgi:sorbitol/mannitol transport system permease protein